MFGNTSSIAAAVSASREAEAQVLDKSPFMDAVLNGEVAKPSLMDLFDIGRQIEAGTYTGLARIEDLVAMAWSHGVVDTLNVL